MGITTKHRSQPIPMAFRGWVCVRGVGTTGENHPHPGGNFDGFQRGTHSSRKLLCIGGQRVPNRRHESVVPLPQLYANLQETARGDACRGAHQRSGGCPPGPRWQAAARLRAGIAAIIPLPPPTPNFTGSETQSKTIRHRRCHRSSKSYFGGAERAEASPLVSPAILDATVQNGRETSSSPAARDFDMLYGHHQRSVGFARAPAGQRWRTFVRPHPTMTSPVLGRRPQQRARHDGIYRPFPQEFTRSASRFGRGRCSARRFPGTLPSFAAVCQRLLAK